MIIEEKLISEMNCFITSLIENKQPKKSYLYYFQKLQKTQNDHLIFYSQIEEEFTKFVKVEVKFENAQQILLQNQQVFQKIGLLKQIFMAISINHKSIDQGLTEIYMNKIKHHAEQIKQITLANLLILRQQSEQLDAIINFIISTIYDKQFQTEFIEESIIYYKQLKGVEELYRQYQIEQKLFGLLRDEYLTSVLQKQLKQQIELSLIQAPIILENDQYLQKFYELGIIIQSNILKNKMYDIINKDMEKILSDENSNETIKQIVELYIFYQKKIEVTSNNDEKILSSLHTAIETKVLTKVNKLSEQYSQYFDSLLTKREENRDLNNVKASLQKGLYLVQYFQAKDIFEHFYTQRLTRRLLLELTQSLELELEMIQNLKRQCGDQYVRKAEEILKEIQKRHEYEYGGVRVNLVVISQNSWTLKPDKLPKFFLEDQRKYFLQQNQQEFKQKTLFWLLDCSNCQVKAYNKYNLIVSAVQAIILNYFNQQGSYKVSELIQMTGLSKDEIMRNIIPLEKEKILSLDQQAFSVNYDFQSKREYIKINQMQKIEKKQEIEESTQKLLHDRKYVIDASIVKIMKRDKQHTLQEIVNLVLKDLCLPLQMIDIKQQVEVLIEKEYLCRDQNDLNLFVYLA